VFKLGPQGHSLGCVLLFWRPEVLKQPPLPNVGQQQQHGNNVKVYADFTVKVYANFGVFWGFCFFIKSLRAVVGLLADLCRNWRLQGLGVGFGVDDQV
jgi:hypothetical protein